MYKILPDTFKGKRILVAEDDRSSFLYIEAILEKAGARLFWVENGLMAVEFVKSKTDIDVVLMDLKMPVMTGYEAIEFIKTFNPSLPIVVQSSDASDYKKPHIKTTENMEFIQKPFTPCDLITAILHVMNVPAKA